MHHKIYTYDDSIHLVYDDDLAMCIKTDNKNMNDRIIKVHKGVDNTINFKVYNRDRKPQAVSHLQIRTRLVNPLNNEVMLERYATATSEKGVIKLKVLEGDLLSIPVGYYNLIVTGGEELLPNQAGQIIQTPFFSDTGNNVTIKVEVTGQAQAAPQPTQEILPDDWMVLSSRFEPQVFHSGAYPAGRIRNTTTSVHTMAVYATNFSGNFKVWGSLEDVPPDRLESWFPVNIDQLGNELVFNETTGVFPIVFQANYMWLKFTYEPTSTNEGTVDKVQLRN